MKSDLEIEEMSEEFWRRVRSGESRDEIARELDMDSMSFKEWQYYHKRDKFPPWLD